MVGVTAALRDRVEARRVQRVGDGMGGFQETEVTLGTLRGRIVAGSVTPWGVGLVSQEVGQPRHYAVLDLRGGPALRAGDLLVFRGTRYAITGLTRQGYLGFASLKEF